MSENSSRLIRFLAVLLYKSTKVCYNIIHQVLFKHYSNDYAKIIICERRIYMLRFIVIALLVIFIGIPFLIVTFSKSKAKGILKEICSSHKINQSFVTSSGCLAFSDDEKRFIFTALLRTNKSLLVITTWLDAEILMLRAI